MRTPFATRLGLAFPLLQAPMAGGTTTPALVAAVGEAGALGNLGAAYLTPEQIRETAAAVRARTARAFGINLFCPVVSSADTTASSAAMALLGRHHAEMGLAPPVPPQPAPEPFAAQFAAVVDTAPAVFSFTFGVPPTGAIDEARSRGIVVIGTATTVDEAVRLEAEGVDAIVAQGSEAGAHRGTFLVDFADAMVGTLALVPQVADAVRVPVIASGGIMDGRGVAAALALGASAVQMGTAFLTCEEAGTPEVHRAAILAAREHETRVTRAFSGRPARGIVNRFMREAEAAGAILPYPLQNALTRPLRTAAAKAGRAEFLSLWAGQGVRLARRETAAALVDRVRRETAAVLDRLAAART